MKWLKISKAESRKKYEAYCKKGIIAYDPVYEKIRNDLVQLFDATLSDYNSAKDNNASVTKAYYTDLFFGMQMYEYLNEEYGMNVREAADPGIWRYLSVCVVPDLVERRYGKDHPDRYWEKPKRIWLSVIWWYIYLSWQGNKEKTLNALKDNTTDEILQMVDRCGKGGYRVDLYRELIKQYSQMDVSERKTNQIFRKMLNLNTARVQVMEPSLMDGGNEEYVKKLYSYFK